MAASADEPLEKNFIRAHALEDCKNTTVTCKQQPCGSLEIVRERMVRMLITSLKIVVGKMRRKLPMCIRKEKDLHMALTANQSEIVSLENVLRRIDIAYQNLDSVEVGITTIDTYFDTRGISRAVKKAKES